MHRNPAAENARPSAVRLAIMQRNGTKSLLGANLASADDVSNYDSERLFVTHPTEFVYIYTYVLV